MKNTKQKIADTARKLFNIHGYGQVTLRMIANDLGMSCGNLNYHFKKREDILEVLYFEMVAVFDQRVLELPQQKISMSLIYQEVRTSMQRMIAYRFFWTDIYNLLRTSPNIKKHFQQVYEQRIKGYLYLFAELRQQGLLKKSAYKNEDQFIGKQMVHFSNTWLYGMVLYTNDFGDEILEENVSNLLGLLYPYLTAKGQEALQSFVAYLKG